jgi:hypothetical protein
MLATFRPSLGNILPCYVHTHFREHQSKQAHYHNRDCKCDGSPLSLHLLWRPPMIMERGYRLETNHLCEVRHSTSPCASDNMTQANSAE